MDPNYGTSTRTFFAKQRVYFDPSEETPTGLDSEEAALVHAAYRKSMGDDKRTAKDPASRVLLLQENDSK
jgi:hypothetical protein